MQPLLVVRPDDGPQHAFAAEILRSEGIFFFQEVSALVSDFKRWRDASLVLVLAGGYDTSFADWLLDYARQGGRAIVFRPQGPVANRLGLTTGVAQPNCSVRLPAGKVLPSSPEALLCPGQVLQSTLESLNGLRA